MNHLANSQSIDATWMCRVTSKNGRPSWDCWSDEFVHFCTLRMMHFVEVVHRGICDKCGSGRLPKQEDAPSPLPLHTSSTSQNISQNKDESRLEKLTILVYHWEEHARKLLDSIRRDRTPEENLVNRTLDSTSGTSMTEIAVNDGKYLVSQESMHRLCPDWWLNDRSSVFF